MRDAVDAIARLRRDSAIAELLDDGWLRHVEWLPVVDSTNNLAKQWFIAHPSEAPAMFVADHQTAGRGRGGNQWWSPSGCLMLTLAISSAELPDEVTVQSQLAFVVGLALAEAVDALLGVAHPSSSLAQLKWPNDVYLDRRKLAGILIEALQVHSQPLGFAIGIGVNSHIDWRFAPVHLLDQATCLSSYSGEVIHCETVLVELVQRLQRRLAQWREQPDVWQTTWRERCLLNGRIVTVRVGEAELVGRCEGIDGAGRLLLRSESQLHALTACAIVNWC